MNRLINQKFANIPDKYQNQGIKWLRLSPGTTKQDGIYILLYDDISKTSLYDVWFQNTEIAEIWVEEQYGIKLNDWKTSAELGHMGIKTIDEC